MIASLLFHNKKEQMLRANELSQYGVVLGDIQTDVIPNRVFICLIRGILIFFASFGTIGGIVSAFELPFHFVLVALSIFMLSMFVAFLYYNRVTFYVGYILLFIIFAVSAIYFYWYLNSGYQAFWNSVFEKYSDYFFLSYYRESTEFITDRLSTISVTMIFVGFLYCILLNITISGYMNLTETFVLTFLPLQIPLYIDRIPSFPYLIMLITVYLTVLILGRSNHFQLSYKQNKKQSFLCRRKKGLQEHSYLSSGSSMLTISIYCAIFGTLFLLLTSGAFYSNFSGKYVSNLVKNTTDEYVKTYIQNGFYSFFNRYSATGGLSHGQLGGISSINPDFQTDLTVTYVPYSSAPVYLRSYIGIDYSNNLFTPQYTNTDDYIPFSDEASRLYGKMDIVNWDADQDYLYQPYFTFYVSDSNTYPAALQEWNYMLPESSRTLAAQEYTPAFDLVSDSATDLYPESQGAYELLYLPYQDQLTYPQNPSITSTYEDMIYQNYLSLPTDQDSLMTALDSICLDAGLNELAQQANHATTLEEKQAARLAIISSLKRYFAVNYDYTMAPGCTPRNYDFVEYFLTVQKRGYCAHFAASSTLLLRRLGIPTRYVEGYMISMSDVMEASVLDESTDQWLVGNIPLSNTGLVEIDVTDAAAHAWIEVYLDGYGWIPVDMTPPSDVDQMSNNDFLSMFSGLFTATQRSSLPDTPLDIEEQEQTENTLSNSLDFLLKPLSILISILILLFVLLYFLIKMKKQYRIWILLRKKCYSDALILSYHQMLLQMKHYHLLPEHAPISDIMDLLCMMRPEDKNTIDSLEQILQKAAFSGQQISQSDYDHYSAYLKSFSKSFRTLSKSKGFPHK